MNFAKPFQIGGFQSDLLDVFRWLAAFLVVAEHLRSLMFADFGAGGTHAPLTKAFYFFTGFGHCAVMIFFVLSGFLVGGKVLDRMARNQFDWAKYGVDRVSRLYAVYVLALVLGVALDYSGHRWFNQFGLYDNTFRAPIGAINQNISSNLTVTIFGINLAMCQTIFGPVFGSNGPLWSLANEFWYYLAGPLLFMVIFAGRLSLRAAGVIGLVGIFFFLPSRILIYGGVWLLGAALYFINTRRLVPLWFSAILFAVCFCASRLDWLANKCMADFLMAITFALVINSSTGTNRRLPGHRQSRVAAGFSYSVYLCHLPFLIFVISAIFQSGLIGFRPQPTLKLMTWFGLILLLAYSWCFLISLATESQTPHIRDWLKQRLIRTPCQLPIRIQEEGATRL